MVQILFSETYILFTESKYIIYMSENKKKLLKETKKSGARSLLKNIFKDSNTSFEELEDERIGFSSMIDAENSEYLIIDANDEHINIRIADYCWHEVSKWDIEEITRIQTAVNVFNSFSRSKIVYHFEDDKMILSTILICPFCESIPFLEHYLGAQVRELLESHKFILNYDKQIAEETTTENCNKGGEA